MRYRDKSGSAFFSELRHEVDRYFAVTANGNRFATPGLWCKAALLGMVVAGSYAALIAGPADIFAAMFFYTVFAIGCLLLTLNLAHDAAHDALTRHRRLNRAIHYAVFSTLGVDARLWQMRHVHSHHLYPNINGCDADIDHNPLIRLSPNHPWKRMFRFQHFYAPLVYLSVAFHSILIQDMVYIFKRRLANLTDIRHGAGDYAMFALTKLAFFFAVIALPIALAPLPWWQMLLAYLVSSMAMSILFVFALIGTHFSDSSIFPTVASDGTIAGSFVDNTFATSLDWNPTSPWAIHLIGGLNAHIAHHLYPRVSHMHYRAISQIVLRLTQKHGIAYHRTNLRGMIATHFRLLHKLGQDPEATRSGEFQLPAKPKSDTAIAL